MREAKMEQTESGLAPANEGWFVVNLADTAGWTRHDGAVAAPLESAHNWFTHFGINVHVLEEGVPNCLYHRESLQEAFLVLDGEPLLIVEGEERQLRKWDFVHCPPDTTHVFVGPGAILMVGARSPDEQVRYPVDPVAEKYGATVPEPSDDAVEAYASAGWSREYRPATMPWPR
jgi:uncharacterized cupin superfamily protein